MKNFCAFLIILTLPFLSFSQKEVLPCYSHLLEVNEEWKHYKHEIQRQKATSFENETERIQYHFSTVHEILQKRNIEHLSNSQNENRQQCLDILDQYQREAIFPQNISHDKRTPYFIDHQNTHCAVGQLMNKTGYQELARKIATKSNYKYVRDLITAYPEILDWAELHGLTQEDLALIQPSYTICSDDCGQYIMCWVEPIEDYVGEFTYLWSPSGDTTSTAFVCPGSINSVSILDEEGTEVLPEETYIMFQAWYVNNNTITIPENEQAQLVITTSDDTGSCNGSASFELTNDVSVTNIEWDGMESTSDTTMNLCSGWHTLQVETSNVCIVDEAFFIEESDQTLNIISISNDTLCAYQCMEIEYETSGFPEGSMFSFQLSDENGVFDEDSFMTLGGSTLDSSGTAVCCAIFANETGTGYRLRIINFFSDISYVYDLDLTVYVVDYELVSNPGMLEVITDIPQTSYAWSNCPGNTIDGETNAQFTNGVVGNEYFVNLIQNGCPTNSNCIAFEMPVGIEERDRFDFELFPNPNNGSFKITSNANISNCSIRVTDASGRIVYQLLKANLDVTTELVLDLLSGMYFVEVRSGVKVMARKKVVVE